MQKRQERALDLGAGYGGMYPTFARYAQAVDAAEPDEESRAQAKARGYEEVSGELGEARSVYGLIGLFDVLEHVEDDASLLVELRNKLNAEGYVALTVPAFQWMWSEHDVLHHHFRRYTKSSLRKALKAAGFEVVYMSYWNMLLFIPAAIVRLLGRSGAGTLSLPRFLDSTFFSIVYVESLYMPLLRLPFGTGIVALARKKI